MPEGIRIADDWLPNKIYSSDNIVYYKNPDTQQAFNWTASEAYVYEPLGFDDWDSEKNDYTAYDKVSCGEVPTGYQAKEDYIYPTNPYEPGTPEYDGWQVPSPPEDSDNWKVYEGHFPREGNSSWQRHELPVKCIINGDSKLKNCMPFLGDGDEVMFVKISEEFYCVWIFIEFIDHEQAIW
jgi:hypothetical protein